MRVLTQKNNVIMKLTLKVEPSSLACNSKSKKKRKHIYDAKNLVPRSGPFVHRQYTVEKGDSHTLRMASWTQRRPGCLRSWPEMRWLMRKWRAMHKTPCLLQLLIYYCSSHLGKKNLHIVNVFNSSSSYFVSQLWAQKGPNGTRSIGN